MIKLGKTAMNTRKIQIQKEKMAAVLVRLISVSMDMQKDLMLPHLPGLKSALFTRRIILINQSIIPIDKFSEIQIFGDAGQGRGYIWLSKGERMKMWLVQF